MKNSHTFSRICGYAMFLLILAQIVLVLASWLITAAMPDVFPRSLLSPEDIPSDWDAPLIFFQYDGIDVISKILKRDNLQNYIIE